MAETQKPRRLADLGLTARGGADARITGITVDSREVEKGYLFAALPGVTVHGAEFIQYALRMEASAILTDAEGAKIAAEYLKESDVAVVIAEDARMALAYAAALFYAGQPAHMVAITGTNGKTSVANFTRQIWAALGFSAANLGTTGVEGAYQAPLSHTTPEPITLHKLLSDMARAGITHAAMEASSHGLAQCRLDGVHLMAAGFTNFTQDHLDYHKDFEDYFDAKAGLFARVLQPDGTAVINTDDPRGKDMAKIAEDRGQKLLTVGRSEDASLRLMAQRYEAAGQELLFSYEGASRSISLPLIGGFQAENVLLASGLAIACGAEAQAVFDTLHELQTVPGRMQLAATRENGATVFVDYAHTPDAVATALKALRPHVLGRIVIVLGAGGDRDTGKRKLMGEAAARYADVVFVTDDNPRNEEPAVIRSMVMEGCPEAHNIGDRAEAILRGVDALGPGDALLIAGKGHEKGQTIGDVVLPFDDVEQASVAVAALEGRLA
ncbi:MULTISPECIES: UDP-N-acetylmuramoyl-L-alanyl-D-glutamate--2,6-diaminopimelate ligase [Halocynthiibacter]|uniref:UDP-N-acetylmuramoyl-L-alanyl-D-glutamate--2,6-diaminopimelate ligase n=1 Tax=Halocynthiibacter halioticoli TaxID=2986804 RepID=A0AAE3LUM0_9RHOB|nr:MULTISPECIES: UDP-N-acetylmuramoyl-L-alanyl-D-glutamate--2,6-diaminopimelate ligase [Halocynthiibacter]MCV6824760.1 UDP-N-acetylmuramoyl-L-alanyl-D-glutamate--2,6-diaminopimelate ligase [Halocynthiibacter halioticoli]MCW4057761.1 UDP-N-acetylmuramoyl-L-alanyl-D-glutamate--2,6-diaminopimelate ligase [Halocynthiibacter sp. SDUM655004]